MIKTFVGFFPAFFLLFLTNTAMASSNLEISPNSNFTNQSLNFNSGQTIYVRVKTDFNNAATHTLNIRDNQYNLINSYNLSENGSFYSTSLTAPNKEGYYSLEAKIVAGGSLTTSVKTIKIGNPQNSNVNVSIHNNVSGQSVLGSNNKTAEKEPIAKETDNKSVAYESSNAPKNDIEDNQEITYDQKPSQNKNFVNKIKNFCTKIINIIWPF